MLHLIAAVSLNDVIGKDGKIPWYLPEDLHHFRELTLGHTVIMGRRTFESIGHGLPGRENIVLSTTLQKAEGCTIATSWDEVWRLTANADEIFIIGGESLYRHAMDRAERIHLTRVNVTIEDGDAFFPKIPESDYRETERLEFVAEGEAMPGFAFIEYQRIGLPEQ